MDVISKQMIAHGVMCFDSARFEDAISYFASIVDYNPDDWTSRIYLASSYFQCSKVVAAKNELTYIAEKCPDHIMREKALTLLKTVIYGEVQIETYLRINLSPNSTSAP